MEKVLRFLKENPVQYMATIGLDGNPKNRPFMFIRELEGRLWFCTNTKKEVYKELKKNPRLEITVANSRGDWIRLSGEAVFENNMEVKKACMEIPLIKDIYETPENPVFTVFYIGDCRALLEDLSSNTPRQYKI